MKKIGPKPIPHYIMTLNIQYSRSTKTRGDRDDVVIGDDTSSALLDPIITYADLDLDNTGKRCDFSGSADDIIAGAAHG